MKKHLLLFFSIFFIISTSFSQTSIYPLLNSKGENISGNNQQCFINNQLDDSIGFILKNNYGKLVPNKAIKLSVIQTPLGAKNQKLSDTIIYSNENGIAHTNFTLGSKQGEYEILASVQSNSDKNFLIYRFYAKKSSWVVFLILGLLGGLVLFMFGMNLMSTGLQKTAGDKMRSILSSLTHNNLIGLIVGAVVTMIIQSSSATSVMLVSFVNSGLMRFKQTLGILLGAAIGTTITAQLIAFKLTDYSLGMIAIGGAMLMFVNKDSIKHWGETIFGFGILFFGMEIMSDAMIPLRTYTPFIELLYSLENPILGIIVGAIFTALIQSSSAFIGIMIILASQGLLTLESSIALLLGANLGTPVTALLASINTTVEAKRVAIALLLYKVILVVLFVGLIPQIIDVVKFGIDEFTPSSVSLPRQIANAHTIFNVVLALVALPFIKPFEKLIVKLLPNKEEPLKDTIKIRYLDASMLDKPAIAMRLAKEETLRLGAKIQLSLELIIDPFIKKDPSYLSELDNQREEAKKLRDAIRSYLIKIKHTNDTEIRSEELFTIAHTLTELSHINDALTKILHRRAEKWIDRNYEFTQEELTDISSYHTKTIQLYNTSLNVFRENSIEDALRVKKKAKSQSKRALAIEKAHYERLLNESKNEFTNSKTYLELINMFKTIGENSVNITKVIR